MPTATWNGTVIAQASDSEIKVVENNIYFPLSSVNPAYLQASEKQTVCSWKGTASYYHLNVAGQVNQDAAWTYRTPKDAAKEIAGFVAFWRGVKVDQ